MSLRPLETSAGSFEKEDVTMLTHLVFGEFEIHAVALGADDAPDLSGTQRVQVQRGPQSEATPTSVFTNVRSRIAATSTVAWNIWNGHRFFSPPGLRAGLHVNRHHHSDVDGQRVDQPLHVSFCLLGGRKNVGTPR